MLKLKLQNFRHLIQRTDSLEKTLMLGGIKGTPVPQTHELQACRTLPLSAHGNPVRQV